MATVFSGARKYSNGLFVPAPVFVDGEKICGVAVEDATIFNMDGQYVFPGFVDVHVHLRQPGFSYKETIRSGTQAAARGGYTAVCAMPNLNPAPDCRENALAQLDIIRRDAVVRVFPYGTITKGEKGAELSDMDELSKLVIAFSDDGKGVQSEQMMRAAMLKAKSLDMIIAAHCEDESLRLPGGCIHDGSYARERGLIGISSESEWRQVERDLRLAGETGCAYHVCHVSTKESVGLIRRAKKNGVDVTCETAPHYLILNDMMLKNEGRFKMSPPIRSEGDRLALVEGIADGTIDMIATDHAPHSAREKNRGLKDSLMGIAGLETAFPVLYTALVKTGAIPLERLVELMSINPRKRFGIGGGLSAGDDADFCAVDLNESFTIDSGSFASAGKATPFDGMEVFGRVKTTVAKGEIVWQKK